ncbi:cation:proton antiporter [Pseudomonas sp. NPDC089547]|uniref:cation:proton antiporter n=1 Tax=Pseudomonas sp. NPDC089547 TaxID=3390652 RepID=UPI003D073E3F
MYSLSLMLLVAIFICWVCRKTVSAMNQPEFIGDILAGILIGPYVLGEFLPQILPIVDMVGFIELLRGLSELGLIWILVEAVWCATNFRGDSLNERPAIITAVLSIFIPFLVGAVLGYYSKNHLAFDQSTIGYVLFCGIAFSVTALPVLAIMIDRLKFISRSVGSSALAAAIYTDAFAWISLAIVVGIWGVNAESDIEVLLRFIGLVSFFVVIVVVKMMASKLDLRATTNRAKMTLVIFLFVILCANITHGLGFHYSMGAIAAIFALARVQGLKNAWEQWEGNIRVVMVPMFFVGTGTMLTFASFNNSQLWLWVLVFVVAGVMSKIIASLFAGVLVGMSKLESLELGFLMATKGTAELVVLSVGYSADLLSDDSYMVLLLLSVVSTLLTAPLIILLNKFRQGGLGSMSRP